MPRQDTDARHSVIEHLIHLWSTRRTRGVARRPRRPAAIDPPRDDLDVLLAHGADTLEQLLHDPEEAVIRLLEAYLEGFRASADPRALLGRLNRCCAHGVTGEPRICAQMTTLLRRFQAAGLVDGALPLDTVTTLLHALLMTILLSWVCADNGPPHGIHRRLADCVQTLFRNWLTW